jgi:hypothetical protein
MNFEIPQHHTELSTSYLTIEGWFDSPLYIINMHFQFFWYRVIT